MKLGFGFGAERLGLLTVSNPIPVLVGVIALSSWLFYHLFHLSFDGDLLRLMDHETESWAEFQTIADDFPGAMPDVFVLAASDETPPGADWLARLQDLQLDLQLLGGVAGVQSVFSLRVPEGADGSRPLLNPFDEAVRGADLAELAAQNPAMTQFLRPDLGLALLVITLAGTHKADTALAAQTLHEMAEVIGGSGVEAGIAGRAAAQREVARMIETDLLKMVVLSVLVGLVVAAVMFSDLRAVAITNLVAPVAMLWTAGFYAALGVALDSATVILPLLAAIIAFADAVHLVVPLQRRLQRGAAVGDALRQVLRDVGPATALTSMSTAVAFGSLALAGGGLAHMALMGLGAVALAWLSVMTLCPLLCLALGRRGLGHTRLAGAFDSVSFWRFSRVAIRGRWPLTAVAVVVTAGLVLAQAQFRSGHEPTEYLPAGSAVMQTDRALNAAFAGASTLLVRVPLPVPGAPLHPDNLARLASWQGAIAAQTDADAVWSRARLDPALLALLPADAADLSPGATHALIAVRHAWGAAGAEGIALKARVRDAVAPLSGGEAAVISGVGVMIDEGATANIDKLRNGLFLSAVLAAGLIALASGSLAAGFGTALAVTLSILLVLSLGALPDGLVNYGLVVALIISVGVAIDDGIHLVNYARHSGQTGPGAYADAVQRAGAAIVLSSVILIASLAVTQAAEMPAIRSTGRQIISALVIALGLTLTVTPAATLVAGDVLGWVRGKLRGRSDAG